MFRPYDLLEIILIDIEKGIRDDINSKIHCLKVIYADYSSLPLISL